MSNQQIVDNLEIATVQPAIDKTPAEAMREMFATILERDKEIRRLKEENAALRHELARFKQ